MSRINSFPKTRFYGSKRRILEWIYDSIVHLDFQTALDLFGGTASVSLLFKAMGKNVTYHDGLTSNYITAHAVLGYNSNIQELINKDFFSKIRPQHGFIEKTFKGLYFKNHENRWLDGAISELEKIKSPTTRNVYFYSLFQACLQKRPFNSFHRANLNLRLNKSVKRSFGNHTTWERSFVELAQKSVESLQGNIWRKKIPHTILKPQAVLEIPPVYDLVYLDPPYVSKNSKNNRDDYESKYHFLEGLSQYSKWPELIDKNSTLKMPPRNKDMEQWNSNKYFKDLLFELIKKHKKSIVVLSYVDGAYPSAKTLHAFFNETFKSVTYRRKRLSHVLAKKARYEILLIGEPYDDR